MDALANAVAFGHDMVAFTDDAAADDDGNECA